MYTELTLSNILNNIIFWKHQEAEHSLILQNTYPFLEEPYLKDLRKWYIILSNTEQTAISLLENVLKRNTSLNELNDKIIPFNNYAKKQSQNFINFLSALFINSKIVSENPSSPIIIEHMINESTYFIAGSTENWFID